MIWDSGKPETGCGIGSRMAFTASVRAWLPGALDRLGVKLLLDAPCGDRNWIKTIDLPCAYVGVDHELKHIEIAERGGANVQWADILHDDLPACDAILSRDFFQHLCWEDERLALANFRKTGAAHIIATCHGAEDGEIKTGDFRRVNFRARFGEPIDSVEDGKGGRILGVWVL